MTEPSDFQIQLESAASDIGKFAQLAKLLPYGTIGLGRLNEVVLTQKIYHGFVATLNNYLESSGVWLGMLRVGTHVSVIFGQQLYRNLFAHNEFYRSAGYSIFIRS